MSRLRCRGCVQCNIALPPESIDRSEFCSVPESNQSNRATFYPPKQHERFGAFEMVIKFKSINQSIVLGVGMNASTIVPYNPQAST